MIKIDLVTGFLGSGKTTFIKKYAKYLLDRGNKIGILENDYGAINIDLMLLGNLMGENCELEMVVGGSDLQTHRRRFRTKLIAMAMSGYDRIIIEPSGVFEPEEFFDILREEPLDRWCEIECVIAIVDASSLMTLSKNSDYILATQLAVAGSIILSKTDKIKAINIGSIADKLNLILNSTKCKRIITENELSKTLKDFNNNDFTTLQDNKFTLYDYEKRFLKRSDYSSLFLMNLGITIDVLKERAKELFSNPQIFGKIIRVKGFVKTDNSFYYINMTNDSIEINNISKGQEVVIVIGERLNESNIKNLLTL